MRVCGGMSGCLETVFEILGARAFTGSVDRGGHRHALCNASLAASLNYQFQNADCPRKVEMWKSQDTG
jgi:hypothetical protein